MSIAELFLAIVALAGLYLALTPLRARLETFFLNWLDPQRRRDRIIDVEAKKADRPPKE